MSHVSAPARILAVTEHEAETVVEKDGVTVVDLCCDTQGVNP